MASSLGTAKNSAPTSPQTGPKVSAALQSRDRGERRATTGDPK